MDIIFRLINGEHNENSIYNIISENIENIKQIKE